MVKVTLQNLSKTFGKKIVISDLSLQVGEKEFFCILGYPGAGKTTLLRLIAGLEKQDKGDVYLGDQLVNDVHPGHRDVAMIFQNLALYPNRTVFDNMAFPLKVRKMGRTDLKNRVQEVAKTLQIEHLLDRTIVNLSGGERQRVAIGRALVRRPKVFLMDEPLSNLDALLRLEMRVELKRLQRELGQTFIYATPDQLEAMSMGDRIAALKEGQLQQVEAPETLYNKPKNRFVASLVGSPAMNFMEGSCKQVDQTMMLDVGPFEIDITRFQKTPERTTGSEVILGIRPEHITVSRERGRDSTCEVVVYVVEPLGGEMILHLGVDEQLIKALAPPGFEAKYGDHVWIEFDPDKIYLFDKKTEEAIL